MAAGESLFLSYGFLEYFRRGLLDIVQPDLARCGGITGARHVATLAAAYAADRLGLRGNSVETVQNCSTKLRQREVLRAAGLPVPEFFAFLLSEPLPDVLTRVRFPCVVKPLVLSASQGVIRADDAEQFARAVRRIRALVESPSLTASHRTDLDRLLVESYIPGAEVAGVGLVTDGRPRGLADFD